jgi:4-amino-4-deoxy-L-arabinose transferase-like glycosyltransferase
MTALARSPRRLWSSLALLGIVVLAIWLPRAFKLDSFVATDEVVWLWRSANFYYALGQRDFDATYITTHPGVVTMWLETAALLLDFPEYRGFGQGQLNKYALFEALSVSKGVNPHDILVTSRQLTVVLNTILLAGCFLYARKFFGDLPSLLGFLLIAFDPFHSGITRMAHMDGPMGSFSFLSLLAFLSFIHNGRRTRDLLISAGAGGLATLAKIPGLIVAPAIALIAFWDFWDRRGEIIALSGTRTRAWFGALIKPLVLWGLVALVTVVIIFPAMWANPLVALKRLTLTPFRQADNLVTKPAAIDREQSEEQFEIPAAIANQPIEYLLRYPYKYVWRITPVILAGLVLAFIAYRFRIHVFSDSKARKVIFSLLLYVLMFTVLMTIPPKTSEKYYLPVYPVFDLIAGLGWYAMADWAKKFAPARFRLFFSAVVLALVVIVQASLSLRTFPYYVTYFNPLLGGNRRANEILMIGSGEGLDLAAEYLNQKPNASQLKVMSWYGIGPFSYYFNGASTPLNRGSIWDSDMIARLQQMDYLVVYANQWQRKLPGGLFAFLDGIEPEYRVWFDGIELARIYNVKSIPDEKFTAQP